jgi:ABC-type branched-subunit amino acid transport system ATPase component
MLKVSGIDVFYGDLQVLWDVSFEVREKEILVLPNGIVGDWEKIKRGVFRIKPAS